MKWYLLFIITFLFFGCGKRGGSGLEIVPAKEMTTLLWDMIRVDEFATANLLKDTTKNIKEERIKLYQQVFKIHKVSQKQFAASFKYYAGRPDLMKVVFDSLNSRGERERRAMYMAKDSLQK